jgi:hypothetical protein
MRWARPDHDLSRVADATSSARKSRGPATSYDRKPPSPRRRMRKSSRGTGWARRLTCGPVEPGVAAARRGHRPRRHPHWLDTLPEAGGDLSERASRCPPPGPRPRPLAIRLVSVFRQGDIVPGRVARCGSRAATGGPRVVPDRGRAVAGSPRRDALAGSESLPSGVPGYNGRMASIRARGRWPDQGPGRKRTIFRASDPRREES